MLRDDNVSDSATDARRAVESLRMGVPNAAAIRATGWSQKSHVERFDSLLESVLKSYPRRTMGIAAGEFGSGKSHLLGYLAQRAVERGFIVSRVVISAETDLAKPAEVLRAALESAEGLSVRGALLSEIIDRFDASSAPGREMVSWARSAPGLLAATIELALSEGGLVDPELQHAIRDWWSGGPRPKVTDIRRALREMGRDDAFVIAPITNKDVVPLLFELMSRLIRAAGFAGWILMFDELELIGRRTRTRRARAYAAVDHWFGDMSGVPLGIGTVGANIDTFRDTVLEYKGDLDFLEDFIRNQGREESHTLADQVARGMALLSAIDAELFIRRPNADDRRSAYRSIQKVYDSAYGCRMPDYTDALVDGLPAGTPKRIYVKRWVNWFDGVRLNLVDAESGVNDRIDGFKQDLSEEEEYGDDEAIDD